MQTPTRLIGKMQKSNDGDIRSNKLTRIKTTVCLEEKRRKVAFGEKSKKLHNSVYIVSENLCK